MIVVGGKEGREKDEGLIDESILWLVRKRRLAVAEGASNWQIATIGKGDCVGCWRHRMSPRGKLSIDSKKKKDKPSKRSKRENETK